ncbi:MAG: hypothetical protein ACI4RI_00070, partial [Ruminococcus sp.]
MHNTKRHSYAMHYAKWSLFLPKSYKTFKYDKLSGLIYGIKFSEKITVMEVATDFHRISLAHIRIK